MPEPDHGHPAVPERALEPIAVLQPPSARDRVGHSALSTQGGVLTITWNCPGLEAWRQRTAERSAP